MSRNITEVLLLRVPLESDYKHTLWFANKSAQETYFKSKVVYTGLDFSYQRKDKVIRYPKDYDELLGCNYVMYKNKDYTDKWYYAFITKMEYVNDGRTDIYIETDVIQSWMFDYTVQPSFVEREHVDSDVAGQHLVPESLETGEYVIDSVAINEDLLDDCIILGATVNLNITTTNSEGKEVFKSANGQKYGGVYSGVKYYKLNESKCSTVLRKLASNGQSDAVTGIFTAPDKMVESYGGEGDDVLQYETVNNTTTAKKLTWRVNGNSPIKKPTKLNGYTPRNKKLLTHPYTYLLMDNNAGGSAKYSFEYFPAGDYCNFTIYGTVTPGYSCRIIPEIYKDATNPNNEGLTLGKMPVCSWATDVYTNWLTQNAVNIQTGLNAGYMNSVIGAGGMLTGMLGGLATGGIGGALFGGVMSSGGLVSGYSQISNILGEKYAHSLQPPQAEGNLNSGDVTYAMRKLTFTAYTMSIRSEFAKIIDGYFDMYGYQVNTVHTPLKNHRENYWYTKTVDVNIDGLVPMDDMLKIKSCYNNGITFWKNPSNIGNYSVSNKTV